MGSLGTASTNRSAAKGSEIVDLGLLSMDLEGLENHTEPRGRAPCELLHIPSARRSKHVLTERPHAYDYCQRRVLPVDPPTNHMAKVRTNRLNPESFENPPGPLFRDVIRGLMQHRAPQRVAITAGKARFIKIGIYLPIYRAEILVKPCGVLLAIGPAIGCFERSAHVGNR